MISPERIVRDDLVDAPIPSITVAMRESVTNLLNKQTDADILKEMLGLS